MRKGQRGCKKGPGRIHSTLTVGGADIEGTGVDAVEEDEAPEVVVMVADAGADIGDDGPSSMRLNRD
jgi:hypothetical protein